MNSAIILFLNLGGGEIAVIMLVVLLFFGADKVPELARGLGKGIRQFKDAMNGIEQEVQKATSNIQKEVEKTVSETAKPASGPIPPSESAPTSSPAYTSYSEQVRANMQASVEGTVAK